MSIRHVYSQTVADGTATSVVRPSDWNSNHNMIQNIGGNTAGTSQVSGQDIVWAGGNNVTLSANGSTISVHATYAAQTNQTAASGNIAGTGFTSTTTGGVLIVGTNNTAGLSLGVPNYITTYVNDLTSGRAGTGFTSTSTAGVAIVGTNNTAGLSLGVPNFITTYVNDLTSGRAGTGFTSTSTAGVAIVGTNNTAGLSIGVPNFITTYVNDLTSGRAGTGTTYAGTNVNATLNMNTNGLALSLSAAGGGVTNQTGPNIAVAGQTVTSGTVYFSNSPTVTFGMDGASNITASAAGGGGGLSVYRAYPLLPLSKASSSLVSGTSGAGSTSAMMYVNPLYLEKNLNAQEIELLFSNGAMSAGTGSCTIGYHLGIYTLDTAGGTTALRSVSTFSAAAMYSQNSATAVTMQTYWGSTSNANSTQTSGNISAAFITGLRDIKMYDSSFTLPASTYYLVHGVTMRSSSVNIGLSQMTGMYAGGVTNHAYLGQSTTGAPMADRYIGSVSSQITGAAGNTLSMSMPSSINVTAITVSNATNAGRWLYPRMYN